MRRLGFLIHGAAAFLAFIFTATSYGVTINQSPLVDDSIYADTHVSPAPDYSSLQSDASLADSVFVQSPYSASYAQMVVTSSVTFFPSNILGITTLGRITEHWSANAHAGPFYNSSPPVYNDAAIAVGGVDASVQFDVQGALPIWMTWAVTQSTTGSSSVYDPGASSGSVVSNAPRGSSTFTIINTTANIAFSIGTAGVVAAGPPALIDASDQMAGDLYYSFNGVPGSLASPLPVGHTSSLGGNTRTLVIPNFDDGSGGTSLTYVDYYLDSFPQNAPATNTSSIRSFAISPVSIDYSTHDNTFAELVLPDSFPFGDAEFQVVFDALSVTVRPGDTLDFTAYVPGGITDFSIEGIDLGDFGTAVNPSDFITGIRFTNPVATELEMFSPQEVDISAVPEPSTFVLAALGLIGLGFVALRRKFRRA